MFTNVADEAMSASDSASFIIAQMKAFNIDASNAEHIIDAVNSVSNHYAVSSGQLAQNLGNMSAAMATGNNTFEQSLGMLTAMTEITRNAAKGSRALITVQGRLNQIVDESSDTGKALTKWYQEHEIAVQDDEGQIRSLYDVLTDVAKIWPTLTKNEQMYYLQQQAGTTQTQNLAALLRNYETAIKATNTAIESNGSAMQENERYMESLQAKEQALKAEFEDFSNRVLSKEFVGGLLDAGKAMLNFANNDVGAAITRIGAFSTSVVGVVGIIGTVVGKLSQLSSVLSAAGGATGFLGTLLAPKTLLIIAGVAAAIAGIAEAIRAIQNAYDEAHPSFEDANKNLQETQTEIQNTTAELEQYKQKLQELDAIDPKDRGAGWASERAELETNVQTAEAYLDVLKQIEQAQTGKIEDSKYITGYTGQNVGDYSNGYIGTEASGQLAVTESQVKAITAEYTTQEEAVMSISLALKDYITGWETFQDMSMDDVVAELSDQLAALGINVHSTVETISQSFDNMGALADKAADGFDELTKAEQDQATQYLSDYQAYVRGLIDSGNQLDVEQRREIQNYLNLSATSANFNRTQATTADTIAFVASAFGITADSAANFAASIGYIDPTLTGVANNMVQLADGAWALKENCIQGADGVWQLKDAVDETGVAINDLVAQEIIFNNTGYTVEQKIAALQQLAIQAGVTAEAIAGIDTAFIDGSSKSNVYQSSLEYATNQLGLSKKEAAAWAKEQTSGLANTDLNSYYSKLQALIDKAAKSTGKDGTRTGGGGSSVKKSIDKTAEYAEKKAKEAAEKAAQEAEQAAKEAAEKAKEQINKTFDALKEAEEAYWDAKIDALETQNKLIDRQTRLEEKLKALQEAKQKKILLYKDGRFQYSEDVGAIASAQQDYNETWRDIYVEEQTEILNDLKDKALAIIEEYRDKALENGELTQDNINSLLSEYHELGNNTYQTVAYGVENITNIVASGMSALTGSVSGATSTATSAISGTMGTIGSSMSKMATGLTSAASLLNKQFGEGLSAILKTSQAKSGKMVGTYQLGENEQTLEDFRNEYWGDTSGKFSKLSLLYGGGQAWWLGMMSKYLEDPEKNANLKLGSMTLKELYDTDWTKKVGSASSLGEIDDYIAREQAKYILNGGSRSDYEALNKIAQDAYRELYFRNPRAYAPGAKGYGGYDPEFSAAQYAVDAALRYSGSNYDVFGVEGARTSGMSAGRVSDLNFLRELVSQGERAGASSISQTQAEWAKNQLNERYQTSYKNTLDAIDKQIEENSKKWYTADAEERDRLHLLNEELRKNRGEYEKKVGGNANGTLSWRGGLSVVGEKGPELRVLNRGDGIIPSNITENLWKIGSDPSKFMRDVVRTTSNIFSISSLSLPNARDAQSLVDGLQELAHQYVAKRK